MIPNVVVRQPWAYDQDLVSSDNGLKCDPKEDRTQQHFAEDADINALVRRFGITDVIPRARDLAEFGEFDLTVNLQDLMNQVKRGEQAFAELPAEVRERFGNEPVRFLEFVHSEDPSNVQVAVDLGILDKSALAASRLDGAGAPTVGPPNEAASV